MAQDAATDGATPGDQAMTGDRTGNVLLVGLRPNDVARIAQSLEAAGYQTQSLERDGAALTAIEQRDADAALISVVDAGDDGMEWISKARERAPHMCIVAVTPSSPEAVASAVRSGAETCVFDPIDEEGLNPVVDLACERARLARDASRFKRRAQETLSVTNLDAIVGNHPAMQRLLQKVAHVAKTRSTVLIHGESGTGKELVAAAIHQNSKRATGPFVRLNCASLSEAVLESELFGHEKGAFTGAAARREGRFEQADTGTLFLDEVSEIPKPTQVKLLRFLQEREFERVGGNDTIKVDTRIVAATNRELKVLVEDGNFREDLYYRLNVVRLDVPPLRARPSDILLLADHFLRQSSEENEIDVQSFTEGATRLLLEYPWPGNVRELQTAVEQAVVLAEGPEIDTADLPSSSSQPEAEVLRIMIPGATMDEIERYAVLQTLKALGGSITKASSMLGLSRRTVQYRLKEWGVTDRSSGYSQGATAGADGNAQNDRHDDNSLD